MRKALVEFRIIPVLGRKVNVAANDPSMFRALGEGVVLTHDAGGINFDVHRIKGSCTKSYGYLQWGKSVTVETDEFFTLDVDKLDNTNKRLS